MAAELLFEASSPVGFRVRVSVERWNMIISIKHPAIASRQEDVRAALETPDEVRRSRSDPAVYLFYKLERLKRWVCAVAKREDNDSGFLITAYPTDAIKEGEPVWTR